MRILMTVIVSSHAVRSQASKEETSTSLNSSSSSIWHGRGCSFWHEVGIVHCCPCLSFIKIQSRWNMALECECGNVFVYTLCKYEILGFTIPLYPGCYLLVLLLFNVYSEPSTSMSTPRNGASSFQRYECPAFLTVFLIQVLKNKSLDFAF